MIHRLSARRAYDADRNAMEGTRAVGRRDPLALSPVPDRVVSCTQVEMK
jgi:hypothetical protein